MPDTRLQEEYPLGLVQLNIFRRLFFSSQWGEGGMNLSGLVLKIYINILDTKIN